MHARVITVHRISVAVHCTGTDDQSVYLLYAALYAAGCTLRSGDLSLQPSGNRRVGERARWWAATIHVSNSRTQLVYRAEFVNGATKKMAMFTI